MGYIFSLSQKGLIMRNSNAVQELVSSALTIIVQRFAIDPALRYSAKKISDLTAPPTRKELEEEFEKDQDVEK